MDHGLNHPSPRQALLANQWDYVESESLASQKLLRTRISYHEQNSYKVPPKENADCFKQGDDEDEVANDDKAEDLHVYDSLEVESHPHAKGNLSLSHTEYLDTQLNQRDERSKLISNDDYSDLRYDPNWRNNLKRNGHFSESSQISIEEYYLEEKSSPSYANRQGLKINGGYTYIADPNPAVVGTPYIAGRESGQPYCLYPQDGQTSPETSPSCHKHALPLRSVETDLSKPPSFFTINESDNTLHTEFREKHENSCDNPSDTIITSTGVTEDIHAVEFQTCYQQEWRQHTQDGPIQTQKISASKLTNPNEKLKRQMEDIVERNKITLGRNTSKCGSYVRAHALKLEVPRDENKVHESVRETSSAENHEDSTDPELRLLQKTQKLQVTQISKRKKAQRKEYPNPSRQQQPPAPEVRTVQGDSLRSPLARPAAVNQPKSQKMTSSQPVHPAIHLNINLNTSSNFFSLLQQTAQDTIVSLASLCGHPHWSHTSKVQLPLSPGYQQTDSEKPSLMSLERLNAQLYQPNLDISPGQCQRTIALKLPLSSDGEDQNWSPNEVHTKQFPQTLPRTPFTTSSQDPGSYAVLPPIGKPMTEKLSPSKCVNPAYHIQRSSSDSYLSQMDKQKQLKARATYKTYSLKDYKQLKHVTHLQGLGPDYTAVKKTKLKRHKLYSNVICEQNKNTSRIPFLLAKDLEGNDKKVPRMKALEYAKTIPKPPLQSQPKQRQKHQSEGFSELMPYLEDLDISQLATLELLRKRHEEEKQVVAHFRKVHAV